MKMAFTHEKDNYRAGRPADRLDALKKRFAKAKKGFRLEKYDVAEETMQSVIDMRSDIDALREFVERNDLDPKKLNNTKKTWITLAAFTLVSGENLGWKCARVAEFLYDFKKVPINQLADQIRKLGGIEKVVRLAAKEDPRQPKGPGDIRNGGKLREGLEATTTDEYVAGKALNDEADDVLDSSIPKKGSALIRIDADRIADLKRVAVDEPAKLIGTRTGGWGEPCLFKVERVIRIKRRKLRWGKRQREA
jgi:hypothetical protein